MSDNPIPLGDLKSGDVFKIVADGGALIMHTQWSIEAPMQVEEIDTGKRFFLMTPPNQEVLLVRSAADRAVMEEQMADMVLDQDRGFLTVPWEEE
jgi:IMP dehydrogenase/GMP reductase